MANQILYGFHNMKDLMAKRVTEVGVQVMDKAIVTTLNEHNRQIDALISMFATRTTAHKTRFKTVSAARLQPLDNNGRALPIKPAGSYDVGYPIQMAGGAWGADYVTSQKMRVQDVNDAVSTLIMADARWVRDHILAALFFSTTNGWTFIDEEWGSLTIQGLANGDSTVYNVLTGADAPTTATNYIAQASGIADATNPFPGIYNALMSHPENSGEVIVLVPSNLTASIEALANFKEKGDPNIREGVNTSTLVGNLDAQVPGRVIGYTDKCWIVEWKSLPDSYMVATTTGGDRPLAMREDVEDSLRGFNKVAERNDHPFYESQYIRRAGFGAWNRVGAVVARIGNGTYAIPTNYGSPMY